MCSTLSRHPIQFVSRRTGLSTHVIRIWERRYGVVQPERSPSNRRLYSDADIERLCLLNRVSNAGHSIGHIAHFSNEELRGLLMDVMDATGTDGAPALSSKQHDVDGLLAACKTAVTNYDLDAFEAGLGRAEIDLPLLVLLDELVGPLLEWTGREWQMGRLRVVQEHMMTATLKAHLTRLRYGQRIVPGAPSIVLSTPAGQGHELGALMAAVAAGNAGWRATYLGPDLPAQEIAAAAEKLDAKLVALSITIPGNNPLVVSEVATLRKYLPDRVHLVLGGGGIATNRNSYEADGISCVETLASYCELISQIRDSC